MIKLHTNSKVYIAVPANISTGGPELLHQLGAVLKNKGFNVYMYYFNRTDTYPVHENYKEYNVPFVDEVDDDNKNVLILSEIRKAILLLNNYSNIKKVIWWLSVDNYFISKWNESKKYFLFYRIMNKFFKTKYNIYKLAENKIQKSKLIIDDYVKKADYHFCQSKYAENLLKTNNVLLKKIYYLSDYLNKNFLKIEYDCKKKENIVAYNPKKGYEFTKKLIEKSSGKIKFVPIINMTIQEVIDLLLRSKIYIDFGNHPGKDRIPREAAVLGCCVITGKRGSANYFEDLPIDSGYKFDDEDDNIDSILKKIEDIFKNYNREIKKFENYVQKIKNEENQFLKDVDNIFYKV